MASKRKATKAELEQFMARVKATGFGPSELTVSELRQLLGMMAQLRQASKSMPSHMAAEHERLIDLRIGLLRDQFKDASAKAKRKPRKS